MWLLMCRSCGEFVEAAPDGETLRPVRDECPECRGTEFKDNDSGRIVRAGD